MLEKGYDKKFVLALIAAAGSIGVIIPPSIPMVIYAVTTNSSVSTLFLAGFVPGILIGLVLIAYSYFYAKKMGYKGDDETLLRKESIARNKGRLLGNPFPRYHSGQYLRRYLYPRQRQLRYL